MGFDVYGKKATATEGEYFRRNVWGWRRLATLVCTLAPDITRHCRYWQSNDGDGLNKSQSIKLADRLDEAVESGEAKAYIITEDVMIKALPRQTCFICHGTGIRIDEIGEKNGMPDQIVGVGPGEEDPDNPRNGLKGWCNGCNGWGTRPDDMTSYFLELEDVVEFSKFLRASGGFKIW